MDFEGFEDTGTWRVDYHLVWTTARRAPLIDATTAESVRRAIRAAAEELGATVHAVGTMPDHVHVVASIPPEIAPADFIQTLKHASARHLDPGHRKDDPALFAWQADYGVMTIGEADLPETVDYVEHQPARHAAGRLWREFELTDPPYPDPV
jgi:REP element-mobilizing transposase RayT